MGRYREVLDMEKPNAAGEIYVSWPSKNIPHGGLMHTRVVTHTPDTEKFLKDLLQESRLATEQRCGWGLRARPEPPPPPHAPAQPPRRPRTSRRRSLQTIRATTTADDHTWRPLVRGEDREELKERLRDALLGAKGVRAAATKPVPPAAAGPPDTPQRINELIEQIRERADWLRDMEELGEGGPHRSVVHDQIALRMRELDALGPGERTTTSFRSATPSARSARSSYPHSAKDSNAPNFREEVSKLTTRRGASCHAASPSRTATSQRTHSENVAQLDALAVGRAGKAK